jgi:hypothetical protein
MPATDQHNGRSSRDSREQSKVKTVSLVFPSWWDGSYSARATLKVENDQKQAAAAYEAIKALLEEQIRMFDESMFTIDNRSIAKNEQMRSQHACRHAFVIIVVVASVFV